MAAIDPILSISPCAHDASVSDIGFRAAIHGIRSGKWATAVAKVRQGYEQGGKKGADGPKRQLPGVTFSGRFSHRDEKSLVEHSGLICADIDGVENLEGRKEQFASDAHVVAAFTSPTGTGLKVVFRCDPAKPHKESYRSLEHHVFKNYGLAIDEKCKDSSRLCFVSHDPELIEHDDAQAIPYLAPKAETAPTPDRPRPNPGTGQPGDDFNARGGHTIPDLLRKHGWIHQRGPYWCRPGKDSGISASLGVVAPDVFHPFSSSPETRLPSDIEGFDPFSLYTWLEHGGDFKASARALGKQGYGEQRLHNNLERVAGPATSAGFDEDGPSQPEPESSVLVGRPLGEFQLPDKGDPSILIGNRWLSRGDIFILASTSGMGKSSLTIQAARTWALGRPLFGGFQPHRPLRSLIVQAEDGDGDIAEVRLSLDFAEPLSAAERAQVNANVIIVTDRIHRGLSFRTELKRLLAIHIPDIVWINPLLAFIGGDVNDSTDVGTFLREQLNSLNEPAKFAYGLVHHTAKPPKEKSQRQWNEVMYEMAGSADLTNAARAVLALQATATPGEFNLIAAKRGGRTGLTRKVAQGVGFRDEPVSTISINHSKARMDVNGQSLPVIHWERGADKVEETPTDKAATKAAETMGKFRDKIPTTPEAATTIGALHRLLEGRTDLTYNGFKKAVIRAADAGVLKMVERTGLGACYYMPSRE